MIAEFVNNDGTYRKVWIRLTNAELLAYRNARLLSWFVWWKTPAALLGEELEAIVCGWRPERYVELKPW